MRIRPLSAEFSAEGHTIGTHSEDHPLRFGKLPRDLVEWEIDKGIIDVAWHLVTNDRSRHFSACPAWRTLTLLIASLRRDISHLSALTPLRMIGTRAYHPKGSSC